MNTAVYEDNIKALRRKFPAWAIIVEEVKRKKRGFDVVAEQSYSGETILKVRDHEKELYLNGKYAPEAPVELWLQRLGKIEEYTTIIVIGISNAHHIRTIMEHAPETCNLLIYEPSFELFRRELQEVDLTFLFAQDIPVGLIVEGLNEREMDAYFQLLISYDNLVGLKFFLSGNYTKLFPEQVEAFVKKIKKYIYDIQVSWNTQVRYTDVNAINLFTNLSYLYEGYGVQALRNILPDEVPSIIVSAGPSLNKNIEGLKKAKGKACIIATDTAVGPLLKHGIIPDIFVIVDGLKPAKLFEHKDISKIAMVTMTGVAVEPMKLHKGKKFFYYSGTAFEDELLQELSRARGEDCTLPNIPTGGSVANTAYSLGIYMGSKTIIFVGQDLALTGNRTHADGTFQEKMEEIDVHNPRYFEIEGIDGGKVLTRPDFKFYLDWFEEYIKRWKHITVVDATEGGALIHGTKIMTLEKAIKKYCVKDYNVKWHISRSKKLFTGEDQKIALDMFKNAERKIQEVKKKAKEGLNYYEKLEAMSRKRNINDNAVLKLYKKLKKVNRYMENDYMARTISDSFKGMEYTLRPLIYQVEEDQRDEFSSISEQGKAMMYVIAAGADEIAEIAGNTVVSYANREEKYVKNN